MSPCSTPVHASIGIDVAGQHERVRADVWCFGREATVLLGLGTAGATSWSTSLATGVRAATALLTAALRKPFGWPPALRILRRSRHLRLPGDYGSLSCLRRTIGRNRQTAGLQDDHPAGCPERLRPMGDDPARAGGADGAVDRFLLPNIQMAGRFSQELAAQAIRRRSRNRAPPVTMSSPGLSPSTISTSSPTRMPRACLQRADVSGLSSYLG